MEKESLVMKKGKDANRRHGAGYGGGEAGGGGEGRGVVGVCGEKEKG